MSEYTAGQVEADAVCCERVGDHRIGDILRAYAATQPQPEDAVRFPFGSWSLDGHWTPNPALKLSEREQRKHNEQHGYPMQPPEDAA